MLKVKTHSGFQELFLNYDPDFATSLYGINELHCIYTSVLSCMKPAEHNIPFQ